MKKITTIVLLLCSMAAAAQNQKIDPTVEVDREYHGNMMEVAKGKLDTGIADSLGNFNIDFNYSFFNRPYKDMYEFSAVPSARMPKMETERFPSLVAKLGIGIPLSSEASVSFAPMLKKGNDLHLNGNFNLFKGDVPQISILGGKTEENGHKTENKEYSYGIGGNYTHAWRSGELNVSAGFNGGYSTYYGSILSTGNYTGETYPSEPGHHSYTRVGASIGIKSSGAGKYGKKMNYAAGGSISYTQDKMAGKLQETYVKFNAEAGPTVGRYNKFMAAVGVEGINYNGTADSHLGLFHITPQYRYENGNLKVNLGVKFQGEFGNKEGADKYHNFIFPAVHLSFNLLPDKLWLYGTVDGSNCLNTYSSALYANPHINPDETPSTLMMGSIPVNVEAGFKGRATDRISYRIFAGYTVHKGLQQFLYNQDEGWFSTFYSNTNEFRTGAELTVSTERIQGGFSAEYSSFGKGEKSTFKDGLEAIGFPALKGKAYLGYNWENRVYAGVECRFRGESHFACKDGTTGTAAGFADLQASVEYVYNPVFTFWLKGSNLLDAPLQYHPFYAGRGIGISAGIIVKL